MNRDNIINRVIGIEGDFSDHRLDPGGATKFGITEEVARRNGYEGDMEELPAEFAREVYRKEYWNELDLDSVIPFSDDLAYELFEYGVNCGIRRAGKSLQRALNAFNNKEQQYGDLKVDGLIGPKTIDALQDYYNIRLSQGMDVLCNAVNGIQCAYYLELAENDEKFEEFVYGWVRHRISFNH